MCLYVLWRMSQSESLFSKGLIRCNTTSHKACKTSSAVLNVFVKKSVPILSIRVQKNIEIRFIRSIRVQRKLIRMVNPCLSASIRVPKHNPPHGKSVSQSTYRLGFILSYISQQVKIHHP